MSENQNQEDQAKKGPQPMAEPTQNQPAPAAQKDEPAKKDDAAETLKRLQEKDEDSCPFC